MTTIVVVRKAASAVIAADSLTTFGTTRLAPAHDRHPHKVVACRDSFIGVAGSAAHSMREVFEFDRFWAIGSGRDFALGGMHAVYDKAKDVAEIAQAGVLAGAQFDTGTAEPTSLHEVRLA